jgi:2-polyprenyl-6-hydroxyphenyl methylase/3-demethylubiquinone-9 3-methyltransferase
MACTAELKQRYFSSDTFWKVEEGSVLDIDYLSDLGSFDIVYSWGVLHHTGSMRQAMGNIVQCVKNRGKLYLAIYNDQGRTSKRWLCLKKAYNRLPRYLRWIILIPTLVRLWGPTSMRDLLNGKPFYTWRNYANFGLRGMNPWRDIVDWVGGLPFEVAKPEEIFSFYKLRGFQLAKLKTCAGGHGCNEFIFIRNA